MITAALAIRSFVRNENELTARPILELVIFEHCSWRPCSQVQDEFDDGKYRDKNSAILRQGAPYVQVVSSCASASPMFTASYPRHHSTGSRQPRNVSLHRVPIRPSGMSRERSCPNHMPPSPGHRQRRPVMWFRSSEVASPTWTRA